jgi:hypothetical protein
LALLVDIVSFRLHKADKDIEVLLLRQQIRILERKLGHKARINRWKKCLLAVIAVKLMRQTGKMKNDLSDSLLLFTPDTVLGWHKALVRL